MKRFHNSYIIPLASISIFFLSHFTNLPAGAYTPPVRTAGRDAPTYDNTYAKDFIMDAPWRVIDANTAIPLTIILKDCDVDDIRELHWIRCWDVTGGGSTPLWDHDFGDERIGDDASEDNYWTYITIVTEGHPSLPDNTLLTPANLGYEGGDAIQLKVSVYYKDTWFNYTEDRTLRVHVGHGRFPWPADWYGGDTHYHTMYTNNLYEFGVPLPSVQLSAIAMGLDWLTVSDHSCDLDETGDGTYSYATHQWEYTIQSPAGIETVYRDVFSYGSSWGSIGADIDDLDSPDFRLFRGVEINLASVDADSWEKTLHCQFYNPEYINSPHSGAIGERPVFPSLPDGLDLLAADGFAYAAHPLSDMSMEWGGLDLGINGTLWGDEDLDTALVREKFRGIEAFNTRCTRYSTDQNNPWADFDAGVLPDDPYPNELLAGVAVWDNLLSADIASGSPRKVFFAGGSDAHGDLNYSAHMSLDNYAMDNAMGKVQTVVYVPGGYGPGNLPPMSEIMAAYRAGRSVATDGPFLEIGLDRDDDGDWYEAGDLMIGDDGLADPTEYLPLKIRWVSLPEFGPITTVRLIAGDGPGTTPLWSFDPDSAGQGYGGTTTVDLSGFGLRGLYFLRAELLTDDGDFGHRAYTNPIWIDFIVPPAAITDLSATLAESAIHLSWSAVTTDIEETPISVGHYVIYRSTDPDFSPGPADSIGSIAETFYDDSTPALGDTTVHHFYSVKAVHASGMKADNSNMVGEFDVPLLNVSEE
jgi:hypothetical protein